MKRRNFLSGLAAAPALAAPAADACSCAPMPQLLLPEGFASVGTKCKITNVKVFGVSLTPESDRPYVFVKLETNQGLIGWGEATLEGKAGSLGPPRQAPQSARLQAPRRPLP
jgi:galactonate dehydratase